MGRNLARVPSHCESRCRRSSLPPRGGAPAPRRRQVSARAAPAISVLPAHHTSRLVSPSFIPFLSQDLQSTTRGGEAEPRGRRPTFARPARSKSLEGRLGFFDR